MAPKIAPRICPRGHVVTGTNKYNPDNCRACRIAAKKVREKKLPTDLIQRIADERYAEMVKEHPEQFEKMDRCLYSKCLFAGEEIANMGKGFTFCAPHAQIALRVLQKQREAKSTSSA